MPSFSAGNDYFRIVNYTVFDDVMLRVLIVGAICSAMLAKLITTSRFKKKKAVYVDSTLLLNFILWYLSLYFVFPICHNQVYMYNESVQEYMCVKCSVSGWYRIDVQYAYVELSVFCVVSSFHYMDEYSCAISVTNSKFFKETFLNPKSLEKNTLVKILLIKFYNTTLKHT